MTEVFIFIFGVFVFGSLMLILSKCALRDNRKLKFINNLLSKSLVVNENPTPDHYLINIPVKIYDLHTDQNGKYRVKFDLIYFQIVNSEFSIGDTNITYDLEQLYTIFKTTIQGKGKASISINFFPRKIRIYQDNNPRIAELRYLKALHKEFMDINLNIKNLDNEIRKIESLIKTIQESDLYKYQVNTYQKCLNLLISSKSKATEIKEEYFHFLRERTLNFYLEDIEPSLFKIEDKQINWEVKYKSFEEDYNLLKNMMEEYKQLKK